MKRLRRLLLALTIVPALVSAAGCVHRYWRTEPVALERPAAGATDVHVATPVKAHLADGSVVVFREGASLTRVAVVGSGLRYSARLQPIGVERTDISIPFDSIVGLETFEGKMLQAQSVVVSAAASTAVAAGTVFATAALMVAIFGSCPTLYADTGATAALQAEGFSYAIAPLLEQRDLDPLRVTPDASGVIRMELRNEALETHYINQLELVAVTHRAGSRVVPDQAGHVIVVDGIRPLGTARDRAGRDVRGPLAESDGNYFSSATSVVESRREGDLEDWIDLSADDLPAGDSVAVVLRLRNSLLNTVLLYDGVLGGRDAPEWLETGLSHISTAIDLSKWYMRSMGMRATVQNASRRSSSESWDARLGDVGPIALRDVAIVLPRPARDARSVRVRLSFAADNWRIDRAEIASSVARPPTTTIPIASITVPTADGRTERDTAAMTAMREADGRYLETQPGQRMTLEFHAPRSSLDESTTYLVSWQGWYREWIRGQWLANPTRDTPWVPGDRALLTALHRWQSRKGELESLFYSTRIPVR